MADTADNVNHPQHYISKKGIEVIDVIEAFTSDLQGIEATDTGNIIKYICRWNQKNGLEDLEKAEWYLKHLIERVKERLNKEKVIDNNDCSHCIYINQNHAGQNFSCTEGVRKWFQEKAKDLEVDDVVGEQISLDEALEIYLNGQNKL